jgi:hypothetical protein
MLNEFENGTSRYVNSILTGDETWLYFYDMPTKAQNKVWVFEDENTPRSVHRIFAKYWAEGAGASSLQSRPRSMRLRAVPLRENQTERETVFQRRGPSKGKG